MRVVFTKTFQTSSRGDGFEAGKIYDLEPSVATHWKALGVARDVPAPEGEREPAPPAEPTSPLPPLAPTVQPRRSRRLT